MLHGVISKRTLIFNAHYNIKPCLYLPGPHNTLFIQQNSSNPLPTGMVSCQIIIQYLYWPKSCRVFIYIYCPCTWAAQLIRGVFHLDVSFSCRFRGIRVPFCVFWSLSSFYQGHWRTLSNAHEHKDTRFQQQQLNTKRALHGFQSSEM
jgi:hypothetical protein